MITYEVTKQLSDKQLRELYTSVSWYAYTTNCQDLSQLLVNCHDVIAAWHGQQLVGLIRTVSDGYTIQFIQDILVHPDYQQQGIGTTLLQRVLDKSKHIRQIYLCTDAQHNTKTRQWYEKQQFKLLSDVGCVCYQYCADAN